jgi:hypothetical protein
MARAGKAPRRFSASFPEKRQRDRDVSNREAARLWRSSQPALLGRPARTAITQPTLSRMGMAELDEVLKHDQFR